MALSFKHPSIISLEYAICYLLGILTVITCDSTCLNYLQKTYLVLPVPLIGSTKFITQHQALEKGKRVYFDVFTRGRSNNGYTDQLLQKSVPGPNVLIPRHYFPGIVVDNIMCYC